MAVKIAVVNPGEWDAEIRQPVTTMRAVRSAVTGDAFVEGLLADRWQAEGLVAATGRAPQRGAVGREALELKVDGPAGTVAVAVARHGSGAITFHLPIARTRRAGRGEPEELRFSILAKPGRVPGERRGFVTKILKVVVAKLTEAVIDNIAEWALPRLASMLEEWLWEKSGRLTGWLRVSKAGLLSGDLTPGVPDFGPSQRGLLLLHGTFSDAAGAFKGLAEQGFVEAAGQLYGERIFAFNHFTFSESLDENALALLGALPDRPFHFDVVTHRAAGSCSGRSACRMTESPPSPTASASAARCSARAPTRGRRSRRPAAGSRRSAGSRTSSNSSPKTPSRRARAGSPGASRGWPSTSSATCPD
jgi:hypothetical protein